MIGVTDPSTDIRTYADAQLIDRLLDVTRSFKSALVCGAETSHLAQDLLTKHNLEAVFEGEFSDPGEPANGAVSKVSRRIIYDDEWVPFKNEIFDLVISMRALHWVNDLPGALIQLRRCLEPDGLFLASLYGGQTLHELRESLIEAETQLRGGIAPRVSPFVDVRDAGNLLVRAGFALPVADSDTVAREYISLPELFDDLKNMGETNAVRERPHGLATARLFKIAEQIYKERHSTKTGHLKATFEIITLTGWSPSESQQKPLAPGSAKLRLSDALETDEKLF